MDVFTLVSLAVGLALLTSCALLFGRVKSLNRAQLLSKKESQELEAALEQRFRDSEKQKKIELKSAVSEARVALVEGNQEEQARIDEEKARNSRRGEELERRAERLERREEDLSRRESKASEHEQELDSRETQVKESEQAVTLRLEESAGLSHEDALSQLLERVENESRSAALKRALEVEEQVKEGSEQTAKNILSMAIQRYAGEYVCERTVSVVSLPSDELKGRIIGREGRNIRALEAATGVDFIIDDTPETIVISAFNPIRREVARSALETLLEDGRIHPTRIESVVRKAEVEFYKVLQLAGEEAAREVGVAGIHPEILKLVGALKYRTSYGQNQWQHALEVAFLCGSMAAELGLDETLARRAGLLHDIGKVMDQTSEGSHALIGAEFARGHGESAQVVNAIASHHEEVEQESVYAVLAQAADAISGARPGARSEMMRTYNQRLTDLERISNSFPGVQRSYAVQAGREIRVLVENARVSDEDAVALSRNIAHKIESEMAFPGQIKVTVIRETRIVQYAR